MEPSNYKKLTAKLAKEKGLNEDILNSIILDSFQTLKSKLTSFDNLRYSMGGLLTFYHRQVKLDKLIERTDNVVKGDNVECELFHYSTPEELKERLDRLREKYDNFIWEKKQYKLLRDGIITLVEIEENKRERKGDKPEDNNKLPKGSIQ